MKFTLNKKTRGIIILFFISIIWGFAFIAQSTSVDLIPTFTLNCLRSVFAFLFLLVFQLFSKNKSKEEVHDKKTLYKAGIASGALLTLATNLQQYGIEFSSAGQAGFITALYIVFVPIIGLFSKKKLNLNVWISIALSLVGFYVMTIGFSLDVSFGKGDILLFLCAIFFALQISVIDHYASLVDGVKMSMIQFAVVAILSFIPMLLEHPDFVNIINALPNIIYLGVISSGVGYTLQIIAQKDVNPTVASLIMSLESVFSLLFGIIILKQFPSGYEIIGAVMIFSGVILSQLKFKKVRRKNEEI